jgi:hypothetical protein
MSRILFTFFCLVLCDPSGQVLGQEQDFEITRHVVLVKRENPYVVIPGYHGDIELGEISVGQNGIVQIEIENPFDETIEFEGLQVGCACVDILDGEAVRSLPAGKSLKFKFKLSTPSTADNPKVHLAINFKSPKNKDGTSAENLYVITVRMVYRLAGMISIQGRSAVLEIPEEAAFGELSAGFTFSSPIQPENLEVFASDALRDIVFNMKIESEESGRLMATIPSTAVANGPIGGEVSIKDSVTGRRSSIWVVVNKAHPIKLSPLSLTFRKNEKTGQYHATALLKAIIGPEPDDERSTSGEKPDALKRSDEEPDIFCFYQGRSLSLEKKQLGNRTYRLDIRVPAPEERPEPANDLDELTFKVHIRGREFEITRGVSFR